jgi:hydrogenase maturation protease
VDGRARPLVICYGNPLRSDDGVAWHIADRLGDHPRFASVDLLRCHQLTPELAEDVSRAGCVVLVDARAGGTPGTVDSVVVATPASIATGSVRSHSLTPEGLAGLSLALFGRVPPMRVVSVSAGSLAVGECLSAPVQSAVLVASEAIVRAIQDL